MRRVLIPIAALAFVVAACAESSGSDTTPATTAETTASSGGDSANGEALYGGTCFVCHGPGGEGIEGLGKPWVGSEFINSSTDEELVEFLKVGRPADHPDNTTGIAMMPRGGNPNLTDSDLLDLVAYMRTLNT